MLETDYKSRQPVLKSTRARAGKGEKKVVRIFNERFGKKLRLFGDASLYHKKNICIMFMHLKSLNR